MIYRRVRKESDELLYTVWSLVTVRNQLPAQVVEIVEIMMLIMRTIIIIIIAFVKNSTSGGYFNKVPRVFTEILSCSREDRKERERATLQLPFIIDLLHTCYLYKAYEGGSIITTTRSIEKGLAS